jgi:alpha-tubulin suppressor-like RCC1 family protein
VASPANKIVPTTCGITTSGAAYCWGYSGDDQLGDPASTVLRQLTPVPVSGDLTFATLSIGFNHVCGVTTSSAAYCWGKNEHGQLGNGTTQASATPVAVSGGLAAKLTRRASR